MEKWANEDSEHIGEIQQHKIETEGNETRYKLKVLWTDGDGERWENAMDVAKDVPILVAKHFIDKDLTTEPGWQNIWIKIKTAKEQQLKQKLKKLSKPKRKEKEVYVKVGAENECPQDHEDYFGNFIDGEDNWRYWDNAQKTFLNKTCNKCRGDMLSVRCKATMTKPAYCCSGRNLHSCGICICNGCKTNVLNKDGGRIKRPSRRKK